MKRSAMSDLFRDIFNSPLGEALASDVAIMGGIEGIRAILHANRKAKALRDQTGTLTPLAPPPTTPPPPPKDLPKALLKMQADQIMEVTKWMKNLAHAHKAEISKWPLEDLETLFALPPDARTDLISAITGPTPAEEAAKIKSWITEHMPDLLSDSSVKIIKGWDDWAQQVIAEDKAKEKKP